MDVTISRAALLNLLTRAAAVADEKPASPILTHVHLRAAGDELTASATDLRLCYTGTRAAKVTKAGEVCVPTKLLKAIAGRVADGDVRLFVDARFRLSVRSIGARKADSIGCIDADKFPSPMMADGKRYTLAARDLSDVIRLTAYGMSEDVTRPHLAALYLVLSGTTLRAVATGGHLICMAERESPRLDGSHALLVPSGAIDRIRPHIPTEGDVTIAVSKKVSALKDVTMPDVASFTVDRDTWATKLVDAAFPSYEQVIPAPGSWSAVYSVDRAALLDALGALSVVASNRTSGIKVQSADGLMSMHAECDDGAMDDDVAAVITGKPPTFGVNSDYLRAPLSALTGATVELRITGELDPIALHSPDEGSRFVFVVMPMRI